MASKGLKNEKYASIFWKESKTVDVINCKLIKPCDRYEGKNIKLLWLDKVAGKKEWFAARIIKISDNRTDLESLIIDENGQIVPEKKKAFAKAIISKHTETRIQHAKDKKRKEQNCLDMEDNISEMNTIFKSTEKVVQRDKGSKRKEEKYFDFENSNSDTDSIFKNKDSDEDLEKDEEKDYDTRSDQASCSYSLNNKKDEKEFTRKESVQEEEINADNSYMISHCLFKIPDVTIEQINFQKRLLASMQYSYDLKLKTKLNEELAKIIDDFSTAKRGKVEIVKNSNVFISETRFNIINMNFEGHKNWKKLVTEILVEIYGHVLKHLTAKGTRGTIGIHPRLFSTLHNFINSKTEEIITDQMFIQHINKLTANRKPVKRKSKLVEENVNTDDEELQTKFNRSSKKQKQRQENFVDNKLSEDENLSDE
ncbi:putative leucine-rich repeat-containing protein DDB_G0290503 [Prorops nasuta]|uniref:putative leucine-rich repeat-containing protein DDB_G0290503 n=1 Tax=Prorops nasuta TaxID=863751 RepID=UPI0034CF6178